MASKKSPKKAAAKKAAKPKKSAAQVKVEKVKILQATDAQLVKISSDRLLSLNLGEMKKVAAYFRRKGRNPTDAELECIAQTWSEHCKHKVFNGIISYVENGRKELIDNLFKQTIVKATKDIREADGDGDRCVSVFEDNAGVIEFDDNFHFAFKVETHNHPSALDPYGGANTGIGGVIRDPMGTCLGATPIFNVDVFCFAPPDMPHDKLPKGILHPKRIYKGVVAGVRDYGNKMGIPTINGSLHFDDRYLGNPLVYCGTGGLIPVDRVEKKARPGDLIVAVGGKTGRDGIHGATFSSIELDSDSETSSSGAVQIGNPIVEKKALDIIIQARAMFLYDCITDCGAGGFSSAVGEMGKDIGAEVHLERCPLKYGGLAPWEILLSEAQERMVLSIPPNNLFKFLRLCERENVEATIIGKFTNTKRFVVRHEGVDVADLDMKFLHGGVPRYPRPAVWNTRKHPEPKIADPENLNRALEKVLGSYNVASKEWVVRQYDHEVQGASVLKPLQGAQDDGPGDAAVVAPLFGSYRGIAVSNGIAVRYGDIDTYWMAASAIDEAIRNAVAVGADIDDIAILDNFCWGNPDKPDRLGDLVRASRACYDIATAYGTPFISGKDSFYNEFAIEGETIAIPPTLLISATGIIPDVRRVVSMDFKKPGNPVYVVGTTFNEMGGSQYYQTLGFIGNSVPKLNAKKSKKIFKALTGAIRSGCVRACHDASDGGLAVAFAESAFAGGFGADIDARLIPRAAGVKRTDNLLFSESNTRFVVEVDFAKRKEFEKQMKNVPCALVGVVTKKPRLTVTGLNCKTAISAGIDKLKAVWKAPLAW
ncbi:MAG: phosphoribosylformylglycinamidine synthase subunit PurL [bacterium]